VNVIGRESPLTVRNSRLGPYVLLTLDGEIDLTSAARLGSELSAAISAATEAVVVDLTGVGFCDSAGLNTLARAAREARTGQIRLVLVGLRGRVATVFRITRLDQFIPVHDDLAAAMRALDQDDPVG
jgi:anti-anti-sigma factor